MLIVVRDTSSHPIPHGNTRSSISFGEPGALVPMDVHTHKGAPSF